MQIGQLPDGLYRDHTDGSMDASHEHGTALAKQLAQPAAFTPSLNFGESRIFQRHDRRQIVAVCRRDVNQIRTHRGGLPGRRTRTDLRRFGSAASARRRYSGSSPTVGNRRPTVASTPGSSDRGPFTLDSWCAEMSAAGPTTGMDGTFSADPTSGPLTRTPVAA